MFFCQKMIAVEMMFALQFAYISFIPAGIECPPFLNFKYLKYSFGWNDIPFDVLQTTINYNYSEIGIKSNFISNVNAMMFIILICPLVYGILTILGRYATHYSTKPRLIAYGKTFLMDVPFTILLINIPNICVSFVVNLQAFGTSNIPSFCVSILMLFLLIAGFILFLIFKKSFREYNL